jgi:hypothetical protein
VISRLLLCDPNSNSSRCELKPTGAEVGLSGPPSHPNRSGSRCRLRFLAAVDLDDLVLPFELRFGGAAEYSWDDMAAQRRSC